MKTRATLDVSDLPAHVMDRRSPIWWGNLLMLGIETTMFALLVAVYFYLRVVDADLWPPPQVNRIPVLYHPVPDLLIPTLNLLLLLLSAIPMIWTDRACLQRNARAVKFGLALTVAFGIAIIGVRFREFPALHFQWNENAYASVTWTILGMHLLHLIIATAENAIMTAWVFLKGLDDQHARDVRVTATYWYWVIGIWALLYLLVYWSPRWF